MDPRTGVLGVALKGALLLAERQGVASERILDGSGLSVADAQRAWTRVPWNLCAEVFTRIGQELGMERLSRSIEADFFETYSELTPLLAGIDDPAWLFRFIYLQVDPLIYPMVDFRLEQLGSDRLRIAAELRPGFDGSESFFFGGAGATPTTTTLMGLPPALTEIQAGPRGSLLTICLPRGEPDLAQRQQVVARRARSDVYNQLTRDRRRLLELTLENLSLKDRVAQASVDAAVALEERRTLEGAMEEALQSFASEAYLVDTRGIHPMNEEGRRALTNDTQDLDLAIMRSISQGGGDGFDVVRLGPNRWWVLRHHIDDELDRRLILARDLWRLTARQTEVLGELARGHANKEIAATLGCSVRTVEIHVGALLDRSGHDSRLALAAALWGLPRTVSPAPRRGSHV